MLKLIVSLVLLTSLARAEEAKTPKVGLSNETSLGYVITGGNSVSETTNLNQKLSYFWTRDILKLTGNYLQIKGTDQETDQVNQTAENWSATLRFEKVILPGKFNVFLAHGWYGDRFQGVRVGHFTDIGGKYYLITSDATELFTEAGYRYTRELLLAEPAPNEAVGVGHSIMPEYHYGRLYLEVEHKYNKALTLGAWIEYLPSITDFGDDQRVNYSPYLTSMLTDILSLKVAYEARYRSAPAVAGNENTDFTFTTSLLAKF